MNLLLFVLAAYGCTQILVFSKILEKIRPSHHFFHCPMCMGFHVGWFLWAINGYTELFTFDYSIATAFLLACISSGTTYMLSMVINDFGIRIENGGDKSD